MKHTIGGKFKVTETELKSLNSKIESDVITDDKIEIELNERLTETEDKELSALLNSKVYNEKKEFASASIGERVMIIAKKLELI